MLNGWKLAAAAALGGLTGAPQEHAPAQAEAPRAAVAQEATTAARQGARVSARFDQAPISQVLDWLAEQRVSFVAAESELDRQAKITLNVVDQPLEQVLDAIAQAMGGHWERKGDMRIYRKGGAFRMFHIPSLGQNPGMLAPDVYRFRTPGPQGRADAERKRAEDLYRARPKSQALTQEERQRLEKEMKALRDSTAKLRQELKSEEVFRFVPRSHGQMTQEERQRLEKEMKALRDSTGKMREELMRGPRKERPLTDQERQRLREHAERALKDAEKIRREVRERVYVAPGAPMPGFEWHRLHGEAPAARVRVQPSNLKELVRSLTPEQMERHRQRGYLTPKDLTASQRRQLGISGDGDWTIVYKSGGQSITIKNED